MTKKELIDKLKEYPEDREVIIRVGHLYSSVVEITSSDKFGHKEMIILSN